MKHDHIPSSEVIQDIKDTLAEISRMEREEKGFRLVGDRWSVMRADSRRSGISERKVFVDKLKEILRERGEEFIP